MQVIPLSEGSFTIDQSKLFIPFDTSKDDLQQRNRGSLLVEIQPFVVITSKDILLIDTGLGFTINGQLQLHNSLLANGIAPSSITKVLLSHLHKDHAGGVGKSQTELSIPNATYFIQKKELDFAFEKGFPSFVTEDLKSLRGKKNIELLEGDFLIENYINCEVTGAHSQFHQVFWIRDNNETIFYGGDDAPQLFQMKHKFVAKYDYDGKKAMELRQKWWKQGEEEKWTFLFYHDIKTPTYQNDSTGTNERH